MYMYIYMYRYLSMCSNWMLMVIHLYSALSMWILKCKILQCDLPFSKGDFTRLLMSANSTAPCSLQFLKVQVTDVPFLDNVKLGVITARVHYVINVSLATESVKVW